MVFRVLAEEQGEEEHFKVSGTISSYDDAWDGATFQRVKGVARTVTVWE